MERKVKVLVIGLGSMGKRRIRLIRRLDSNIEIVGTDMNEERCENVSKEYDIVTYPDFDDALSKNIYVCAFISTSPLSHANIINKCLLNDMHVFSEINLVDTMYDENMQLAFVKGKKIFLSSTFLYRKEIEYIKKRVHKEDDKVCYTYHAGQYLPDWHPWESFKNFFVGKKETNACREFMAIEFPWIREVFGKIRKITVTSKKISQLDVDYPDIYFIDFEHDNGNHGSIVFDVVSRMACRNLEIFGEKVYLRWNGTPDGLIDFDIATKCEQKIRLYDKIDKREEYSASIIEDAYSSEIQNFFASIEGKEEPRYSFEKDLEILKIINNIEDGKYSENNSTGGC